MSLTMGEEEPVVWGHHGVAPQCPEIAWAKNEETKKSKKINKLNWNPVVVYNNNN